MCTSALHAGCRITVKARIEVVFEEQDLAEHDTGMVIQRLGDTLVLLRMSDQSLVCVEDAIPHQPNSFGIPRSTARAGPCLAATAGSAWRGRR